jgi:hypothetical protein
VYAQSQRHPTRCSLKVSVGQVARRYSQGASTRLGEARTCGSANAAATNRRLPSLLVASTTATILTALTCRWRSRPQHQKRTWWACRTLSVKTLNVGAHHGGIASRGGKDGDRVDFVRHFAVRMFPHVHHHRGDRHTYPADPEKRERALLAPPNVLFSCHRR